MKSCQCYDQDELYLAGPCSLLLAVKVCTREWENTPCLFVCAVVQRTTQSSPLCRSLLSNAKQEINVAHCVCTCVCVCVSGHLWWLVSLSEDCASVCVCVCKKDVSAHKPKVTLCQLRQANAISLSQCWASYLQIDVSTLLSS